MYSVNACQVCGETQRTIVAEYNRLIFLDSMWQNDLARFDYALCHGCGLVYATRRPERDEYEYLYANFNEFLAREKETQWELTAEKTAEIDDQFLPWWEIRSKPDGTKTRRMLRVDLANALTYLPYLTLHVPLEGAKVLHIRAKGATLADILKRLFGAAKVDLITLFPEFTYMAEKQDVRAAACLDYENFQIPFDEKYNLILENHVFVHMLDADATFNMFLSHLEDGGFLFVHKELDDARMFKRRKNLFAELRPFHFQQHDVPTLERMLRRYGFDVPLLCHKSDDASEIVGIGKLRTREPQACPRIGADQLRARLDMYARWRDESILSLPRERCQALFAAELQQVWQRVRANGGLKLDKRGKPTALRWFSEKMVKDQILEISSAHEPLLNGSRSRVTDWLEAKLRGTRLARFAKKLEHGTARLVKAKATDKRVSS